MVLGLVLIFGVRFQCGLSCLPQFLPAGEGKQGSFTNFRRSVILTECAGGNYHFGHML